MTRCLLNSVGKERIIQNMMPEQLVNYFVRGKKQFSPCVIHQNKFQWNESKGVNV